MWTPKNAAKSCSCNFEFVLVLLHSVLFLCCLAPAYFCYQVGSKIAFMHADCFKCEQSITGVNAKIRYGSLLKVDLGRQSEESNKGNKQDSGIRTCGGCSFAFSGPFPTLCAGVYCIDRRFSYHVEPRYRGTA